MLSHQDLFFQLLSSNQLVFDQLNKPLLKSVFSINNCPITLILTQSHLVLSQNLDKGYFCPLNSSVKFQVLRKQWENERTPGNPIGICLQKQNSTFKIEFLCDCGELVEEWGKQLGKKINERNFHRLFKAKRKIGKGAFATVYLAERLIDGKMVAVKAFSKEKQYSGDKGRQSLENQIKIMRVLDHPNIMKLEGIYQTENSIYVILEYLEGIQLNQELKSQKHFTQKETKAIIKSLLSGLKHLAQKRIIHRDLKPENIIFRTKQSLELAICDFGLATHADQEKYLFVRCGTPGFVAPQIINIRDMTMKSQPISDVFSAGIILHYLLLNKSIFQGIKYAQILNQNRACEYDFRKDEYKSLNAYAFDLLRKMLQKNPQNRISPSQALGHPFFIENTQTQMQIQQNELTKNIPFSQRLFQQKDISQLETPASFKNYKNVPSIKKKNSSPCSDRQKISSFYGKNGNCKQNYQIPLLKKSLSGCSNNTRSKSKYASKYNKMIDQIDEDK